MKRMLTAFVAAAGSIVLVLGCSSSTTSNSTPSGDAGKTDAAAKKAPTGSTAGTKATASKTPTNKKPAGNKITASAPGVSKSSESENPCTDVPDLTSACVDGTTLAVCIDKELYAVNCQAFPAAAYPEAGYTTGACTELETGVADCFGCAQFEDGSTWCCTGGAEDGDICCNQEGQCVK